jgi:hypothetical protein
MAEQLPADSNMTVTDRTRKTIADLDKNKR